MGWLPALPRAAGARELLDGPVPPGELARSLGDVARLNRLFGGRLITLIHVRRMVRALPADRTVTVLDVGTGGADYPLGLARWGRRAGRRLRILALDRDGRMLEAARRRIAGYPEITLVQGEAGALPVRPGGVDVVISALTLHHLEPEAAARCLAEMDAAARRGLVVNDLARSRSAYALVWLATRLLARSPLSRHDGPLSVLRAYRPEELRALAARTGLGDLRLHRYPPLLRQCVVRVKP